jgi:CO/xanthine dehydrogenase Mo-binding subunit
MEQNIAIAKWDAELERFELWTSTQAPHFVVTELAHVFGLRRDQVVTREVAVGGGFGSKSKVSEHEALAAALARKSGRMVKIALSREEEFAFTKPRHAFRTQIEARADREGRIRLFEARIDVDNGSYNHYGPSVMHVGVKTLGTIYRPDGAAWDARLVDTALPPGGQFRGYGSPQVSFALESAVDELAGQLGVDPLEFRIRNANEPSTVALCGAKLTTARLDDCLRAVRDAIGWTEKKRAKRKDRGVGVAAAMHGSGSYAIAGSNTSMAAIDLYSDGHARVRFGGADAGTGQRTILAQIAAEELSLPYERVEVMSIDSERTPIDQGAWSSRGTHMTGHAVRKAARGLAERLRAGERVPSDGVLTHEDSYTDTIMEAPGSSKTPNFSASYTFAAHAAEVEVDRATGHITVLDFVAAHDIGRAINPTMVEGQIVGGVAMGLGAVLGEELIYENGRPVNPAYLHYALPRAADLPRIRPILIEDPDPNGPVRREEHRRARRHPSGAGGGERDLRRGRRPAARATVHAGQGAGRARRERRPAQAPFRHLASARALADRIRPALVSPRRASPAGHDRHALREAAPASRHRVGGRASFTRRCRRRTRTGHRSDRRRHGSAVAAAAGSSRIQRTSCRSARSQRSARS